MFNYILYRAGEFIALNLPLKAAYAIAVFISDIRYLVARKDRREVTDNLKTIFPDKSDGDIKSIQRRMFRNFAKYLVDFFRFSKLDANYVRRNIKVENMHYFAEVFSEGKGVIAVTAHLGNWELAGAAVALLGYPVWAVALPHKDKKVNDFFNSQRASKGITVIPLGKAVRRCLSLLADNKLIALVGDRDFTEKGAVVEFFGRPSFFPVGPAAFHFRTGAAIVPAFMLRNENGGFTLKVERPIRSDSGENRAEDTVNLINRYKAIIEDYVRKYPDQWYMFQRFWI